MKAELITHQIPLERVIVYFVNTQDVGGDEYCLVVSFSTYLNFWKVVRLLSENCLNKFSQTTYSTVLVL